MIDTEVLSQVTALPKTNRSTALAALQQPFAVHCFDINQAIQLSDAIAPEHLEIQTRISILTVCVCVSLLLYSYPLVPA